MDGIATQAGMVGQGDPDLAAFIAATGATDTSGLRSLVGYVKSQSLWGNFVIYPMKSDQNNGSGSAVNALGGLTQNDMTLVNSPAWGADGLAMASASSQYGRITDFIGSETLYAGSRVAFSAAPPSGVMVLASQFDTLSNERSWILAARGDIAGDPFELTRSVDGTGGTNEVYHSTDEAQTAEDQQIIASWIDGGGRNLWQNKVAPTLSLTLGLANTSRLNSGNPVLVGAAISTAPGSFFDGTFTAQWFANTSLTTAQREQITDLVNAL